MRYIVWLALIMATVAGGVYFYMRENPADVYQMSVRDAYHKLSAVSIDGEKREFFGTMGIAAKGNGLNKVTWISDNGMSHRECVLDLAALPDDAAQTRVAVSCIGGGAGEGAAAGMTHNMFRNNVIELVDATLTGRAFDRAKVAITSARWPGDGVDGSMGAAMGTALKMDSDMKKMIAEAKEEAESARESSDYESADSSYAESESFE